MWDFLRDLGEVEVAGSEIVQALHDDPTSLDPKSISTARLRNIAAAYAWWIARGSITLMIFKVGPDAGPSQPVPNCAFLSQPVDFTALQSRTKEFFEAFFTHLLMSIQARSPAIASIGHSKLSRNEELVAGVFKKAAQKAELVAGIAYFLAHSELPQGGAEGLFMDWATQAARDVLKSCVDEKV
jgi:nucleolar MIF4G domain-containing protein 1